MQKVQLEGVDQNEQKQMRMKMKRVDALLVMRTKNGDCVGYCWMNGWGHALMDPWWIQV